MNLGYYHLLGKEEATKRELKDGVFNWHHNRTGNLWKRWNLKSIELHQELTVYMHLTIQGYSIITERGGKTCTPIKLGDNNYYKLLQNYYKHMLEACCACTRITMIVS